METAINVKAKIQIHVNATKGLFGFIDKSSALRNKQGFDSVEAAMEHSEKYGIYKTSYVAHASFLGHVIISSDECSSEEKAIKQAIKLAKEYLQQ